jgi:hypothetical protein
MDYDSITKLPPESPERLSIAHLLLWTTMSAALLGIDRALEWWGPRNSSREVFGQFMALCYAPLFGASAAATCLMAWRWIMGGPRFPSQPGHWLLVVSGLSAIVSLGLRGMFMALSPERWWPVDYLVVRLCANLLGLVMNVLAARSCTGSWRITFGFAVAVNVISLLSSVLFAVAAFPELRILDTVTYTILTLCVVVSAAGDRGQYAPRDYLHWTGVVVRVVYTLLTIGSPFLFAWLQTRTE